ncbi:metalloprotease family protein, partial [Acinetobacter guillouiae]|uniref:metalloprotease family protein n=1 Tax=Acinetobacter guillouiae TaxID=106649 RepID=UPI003AF4F195
MFSGSPAKFGFRRGMAYAGRDAYFCKTASIVIALAPVLIWGLILGLLLDDVPTQYFWYLYAIQIFNFAGAVGDFYVTGVI